MSAGPLPSSVVDRSLGALLRERAHELGDAPFVVGPAGLSYATAYDESARLASGLASLGVGAGDLVGTLVGNRLELLMTWFATAQLGAVEVPLNPVFRGASLEYLLNHCAAKVLVVEPSCLDALLRLEDRVEHLERLVVLGDVPAGLPWPAVSYHDLVAGHDALGEPHADPSALMAVLYTSGTTGHPKGVMESHRCAMHWGRNYATYMSLDADDTNFLFPPLHHTMSQFMGIVPALLTGGRVAIGEPFSASRFWERCRRDGITVFNFTGGVLSFLWKQPAREDDLDNPVRRALGVPIPDDLYPGFEHRFGLELLPCFGTSESNVVCFSRPGAVRRGSSGRPIEEFAVAVVDDSGAEVVPGVRGEIVTRPREPDSMMRGYYRRPEATAEALRDLWYHTGDMGYLDADGFLFFVDRKKDSIRRRGENISSFEIERIVDRLPQIAESAAVGVASEHGEEEVKLAVVFAAEASMELEELWAYCDEEMAPFMVPRYLEVRDALPKTPTERVRKVELRESGVHAGVADRLERQGATR